MRLVPFTASCVGLLGSSGAAFGQTQQPASPPPLEEVIVTGSYIGRPTQADSPAPLTVISQDDIGSLGVNEISDVIERLTINTGSQNNLV